MPINISNRVSLRFPLVLCKASFHHRAIWYNEQNTEDSPSAKWRSWSHYLWGFIHPRWLARFLNHQKINNKTVWQKKTMHILGWCPHPQTCVSYQDQWHDNFRSQQNIDVLRCRSSLYSQPWLCSPHFPISPSLAIWYPSYTLPSDVFQILRKKKRHPEFSPATPTMPSSPGHREKCHQRTEGKVSCQSLGIQQRHFFQTSRLRQRWTGFPDSKWWRLLLSKKMRM